MLLVHRLRDLSRRDLRLDAVAGLTVAFVLIPQALAYALLAGVSPVLGLYSAAVPALVYAWVGGSRHMAMGPVALTCLLLASGLSGHATPGTPEYEALAVVLTSMVGVLYLLLGALRAGFFVNFLSHPTVLGFNAAAALLTGGSQIKSFFGIDPSGVEGLSAINPWPLLTRIGSAHPLTTAIATVSLLALLAMKRWRPKWPSLLILCVVGTAAGAAFELRETGVAIVGEIPRGLPPLKIAWPTWSQVVELWPTALSIAVVGYGASITAVKALASEPRDRVAPNRELIAFGASNFASAAVGGFPVTGALARGAVMAQAGARTQLTGFFAGLGVLATLLWFAPAFETTPKPVLAAIIMLAASSLIDLPGFRKTFSTKRNDGITAVATLVATLVVGPELGLLLGILVALAFFVGRTTRPHTAELGRIPGTMIYRNVQRFTTETCPQVGLLRIDAPLYYANARYLEDRIARMLAERPDMRALVLDFAAVNDMDATAVLSLTGVAASLERQGAELHIAGAIGPVRDLFTRSGLREQLGPEHFHRNVLEAAPKLMARISREYCETRCRSAAFPDCTTIPRRIARDSEADPAKPDAQTPPPRDVTPEADPAAS